MYRELTDLNYDALRWCDDQDGKYHKAVDCVPNEKHEFLCLKTASVLESTPELAFYLCPERKISFDGFVNFEGRRFGVPYWYTEKTCRVKRDGCTLYVYDSAMTKILTSHDVTWSRRDSYCRDQYVTLQPEEQPSVPVKIHIQQEEPLPEISGYSRFHFGEDM